MSAAALDTLQSLHGSSRSPRETCTASQNQRGGRNARYRNILPEPPSITDRSKGLGRRKLSGSFTSLRKGKSTRSKPQRFVLH